MNTPARQTAALTALLLTATFAPARAQQAPSLQGEWTLDAERSDSLDPLLDALDVPWSTRLALRATSPRLIVRDHGGSVDVTTDHGVKQTKHRLVLDDSPQSSVTLLGPQVTRAHRVEGGGVASRSVLTNDGTTLHVGSHHELAAHDELRVTLRFSHKGRDVRLTRVFTRITT